MFEIKGESDYVVSRLADRHARSNLASPFRRRLFLHQDGFILSITLGALQERGMVDFLFDRNVVSVDELARRFGARPGYLHVALRCLAQQGWPDRGGTPGTPTLIYRATETGKAVTPFFPLYQELATFLRQSLPFDRTLLATPDAALLRRFAQLVNRAGVGWSLRQALRHPISLERLEQIRHHLDGNLTVGTMLGLWNIDYLESPWRPAGGGGLAHSLKFLQHLGWFDPERCDWTDEGLTARSHALHYGMVGSYIPMLADLSSLLFGSAAHRTHATTGEAESHVERRLNVLAGAAAHRRYFQDADNIFIDLFNRTALTSSGRSASTGGLQSPALLSTRRLNSASLFLSPRARRRSSKSDFTTPL